MQTSDETGPGDEAASVLCHVTGQGDCVTCSAREIDV